MLIFKNDESKLELEPKLKRSVQEWRLFIAFDNFNDIQQNELWDLSLNISHNEKVSRRDEYIYWRNTIFLLVSKNLSQTTTSIFFNWRTALHFRVEVKVDGLGGSGRSKTT